MFGLADTRSWLNLGNLEYHQSVAECHPNLVIKFTYLEDLDAVYPFNTSGLDGLKVGVYFNIVITYKTSFVANTQRMIEVFILVQLLACNIIFSWTFLKTIKASILTDKNLSKWDPERKIQSGYNGITKIQGSTQDTRVNNGFVSSYYPQRSSIDTKHNGWYRKHQNSGGNKEGSNTPTPNPKPELRQRQDIIQN